MSAPQQTTEPEDFPPGPWLITHLCNERYALPVPWLREVLRGHPADPIPGGPPALLGVMHVRGEVLPVMDLRIPLSLPPHDPESPATMVIVDVAHESFVLRVDAVADVVKIAPDVIQPHHIGTHPEALCGFARLPQGLVQMIDPRALLPTVEGVAG